MPRRPTTRPPKPTIEETPRLLRSFAADIAAAQAKIQVPIVEFHEGLLVKFIPAVPPAEFQEWFLEALAQTSWQVDESVNVLMRLVCDEDRDRLTAALADRVNPIPHMIVHDVRGQLLGFYTGRPTEPPTSSPVERSKAGAASGPGAPKEDSTPSTSDQGS